MFGSLAKTQVLGDSAKDLEPEIFELRHRTIIHGRGSGPKQERVNSFDSDVGFAGASPEQLGSAKTIEALAVHTVQLLSEMYPAVPTV